MKVSLNWLKDYVSAGIPAGELAHKLTMAGLEVESTAKVSGDTVFELEITPNRSDCLNMLGIAREVSALLNKPVKVPFGKKVRFPSKKCDIKIDDQEGCTRYVGTLIKNVQVKPAASWITKRIEAVGISSISNIVDITNFCLMETGQPLHAFDYDKLSGGKLVVRRARKGEKIFTIDGVERELDPSILVIADAKRPVAIAGVMGGKDAEVTEQTKNILLESAYFDPILIRRVSRKLGITSDSSYRFERGVDYDMVEQGSDRAISLILEYAKGTVTQHIDIQLAKKKITKATITISKDFIENALGATVSAPRCLNILRRLKFKVVSAKKNVFKVTPPSFRGDIKQDVDIVEEISRIIGYDNLPASFPVINIADNIVMSSHRWQKKRLRELLTAQGFNEIITYTMTNQQSLDRAGQGSLKGTKIQNALTQDQEMMRPSLLPGFLSVAASNFNRGQKNIKLFEIGKIYSHAQEKDTLGALICGDHSHDWRRGKNQICDYYDIKGVMDSVLREVGAKTAGFELIQRNYFESGQSAAITVDGKHIGEVGKVSDDVLEKQGIKQPHLFFAQVDMEGLYPYFKKQRKYQPVIEYPAITHDISLAVKEDVAFVEIKRIAFELGSEILTTVKFNEQYLDPKRIPSGHRGLVFSLRYESSKRTLREDEVTKVHNRICQALIDRLGVIRR